MTLSIASVWHVGFENLPITQFYPPREKTGKAFGLLQ